MVSRRAVVVLGYGLTLAVLVVPVGAAGPEPFDPKTELFSVDGGARGEGILSWLSPPAERPNRPLIPLPDRLPEF